MLVRYKLIIKHHTLYSLAGQGIRTRYFTSWSSSCLNISNGRAPGMSLVTPLFVHKIFPGVPFTPACTPSAMSCWTFWACLPLSRHVLNFVSFNPSSLASGTSLVSANPVPLDVVRSYIASVYFQNASFPPSSAAHSLASASFWALAWNPSGKWRYTSATLSLYASRICLVVGWNRLQNGHSKSEYSMRKTCAFGLPRIWSAAETGFTVPAAGAAPGTGDGGVAVLAAVGAPVSEACRPMPPPEDTTAKATMIPAITMAPGIIRLFCDALCAPDPWPCALSSLSFASNASTSCCVSLSIVYIN